MRHVFASLLPTDQLDSCVAGLNLLAAAYQANRQLDVPRDAAAPSCLIGASNFFELAVATTIGLSGLKSGAALATVAGVLIEVPVMLVVVKVVNSLRH